MSRRPITIWVIQIMLAVFMAALLVGGVLVFSRAVAVQTPSGSDWIFFVFTAFKVALLLGVFVAAFHGLQKRKSYGRWISVALLVLWWAWSLYSFSDRLHSAQTGTPQGPLPTFKISAEELPGAIVGEVLVQLFMVTLIFRMIFAKSVKEFFQPRSAEVQDTDKDTLSASDQPGPQGNSGNIKG